MNEQVFLQTFLFAEASVFSLAGKETGLFRAPTGQSSSDMLFQSVFSDAIGKKDFLQRSLSLRSVSSHSFQNALKMHGKQTEAVSKEGVSAPVKYSPVSDARNETAVDTKQMASAVDAGKNAGNASDSLKNAGSVKEPEKDVSTSATSGVSSDAKDTKPAVSAPDVSMNKTGEIKEEDALDAKGIASRIEFLLVQFMFFLQFGMNGGDAQNVNGVKDAGTQSKDALTFTSMSLDAQTLPFADIADGGLGIVPANADISGDLLKQLQQMQNAAEKLFDSMAAAFKQENVVSAVDTQKVENSQQMLASLQSLLQELQCVVEDVKVTTPHANDAGSVKLKQLMEFAEEVKRLMQQVSENGIVQSGTVDVNAAEVQNAAAPVAQETNAPETLTAQGENKANNVNAEVAATGTNGAVVAEDENAQSLPEEDKSTTVVSADNAQKNSDVKDADDKTIVSSDVKKDARVILNALADDAEAQDAFVKAADNEAAKELQLKNAETGAQLAKAQAQTFSLLGKTASQILKSTAAVSVGMEFKELMNVPKAFAEEVQKILNLQDISIGGVQNLQDALVSAVLGGGKLQLALSDPGSNEDNLAFSMKDFAKDTGGAELKPSPSLQPLLSEFQKVLQQNTPVSAAKDAAQVVKTEDNLLRYAQSIVKSGQLLLSTGVADLRLRLKPEQLGDLRLRIMMEEGILSATLHAQSQQVKEILESSLSTLKQSLKDHGIQVDKFVVTTGNQSDYSQAGQNAEANAAWEQKNANAARHISARGNDDESENMSVAVMQTQLSRAKLSMVDYFV